jgi:hypothetical protein
VPPIQLDSALHVCARRRGRARVRPRTHDGQKFNKDLAYAVVPDGLTAISEQFIKQIVVDGKPALPGQ